MGFSLDHLRAGVEARGGRFEVRDDAGYWSCVITVPLLTGVKFVGSAGLVHLRLCPLPSGRGGEARWLVADEAGRVAEWSGGVR